MWRALVQTFPNFELRQTLTKVRLPSAVTPPTPESKAENLSIDNCDPVAEVPSLVISGKLETPPEVKLRKPSRFGNDARRALLRSGAAMETEMLAPCEALFLTGTLPGSTHEAMNAIAQNADYIVHRLKAWLTKYHQSRYDFYVWELQKRGALHLHFCTHIPSKTVRDLVRERFKNEWCNLLDAVGSIANCDMYKRGFGDRRTHSREVVRADAQEVRKSVSAYLSKYASKDANKVSRFNEKYAPKRWWGRSRPLKALTDKLSTTTEMMFDSMQKGLTYIRNLHDDLSGMAVQQYSYRHKCGVGETYISYLMRSSWNMAREIVSKRGNGLLTEFGKEELQESLTISLLNRLTVNFSTYSKSSRVGIEPGFMHSMRVCLSIQRTWQDSGFGCVKVWIESLLLLSYRLTCEKMNRLVPSMRENPNAHPIQHLWKLRECLSTFEHPTWEDIKICDLYLDRAGYRCHLGTKPIDDGVGDTREPEPSSLPRIVQLEVFH